MQSSQHIISQIKEITWSPITFIHCQTARVELAIVTTRSCNNSREMDQNSTQSSVCTKKKSTSVVNVTTSFYGTGLVQVA